MFGAKQKIQSNNIKIYRNTNNTISALKDYSNFFLNKERVECPLVMQETK
jgi:hypothetical protein